MQPLRNMQSIFGDMVLGTDIPALPSHMAPPSARTKAGLRIYQNNVVSSLTEALEETFPVVKQLVGDDFFKNAAHHFIRASQTDNPILAEYGRAFPDFLAAFEPAKKLIYLPDVARLEFAWLDAYHGADAAPVSPQDIGSVPPERLGDMTLTLHPTVRLMESLYPIGHIWQAHQNETSAQGSISLDDGGDYVLIARPRWRVMVKRLMQPAFCLVQALHTGAPLGTAVEQALSVDASFDLGACLGQFLQDGIFVDFHLP